MPVTVTLPVTSIPAPKLTFKSKSDIIVLKVLPSPVSIAKVLFAEYQSVESTPATAVLLAAVSLPSSSTVNTGI